MRFKLFVALSTILFSIPDVMAQNLKFGSPTAEEFSMDSYDKYPDAEAVVLATTTTLNYDLSAGDYRQEYVVRTKLKVLKPEGTRFANVEVEYVNNPKEQRMQEDVISVKATAYNVEGGKTVKSKMDGDQVFKSRVNEDWMVAKFTIPQVKVGTLIEYEYHISGNCFYSIHDWYAQGEIPVVFARYDCTIPAFFVFNIEKNGLQPLEDEVKRETLTYKVSSGQKDFDKCFANRYIITGRDLAPIKDDDFVWHAGDYCARVTHELEGMQLPGAMYHEYSTKWESIDERLLDYVDFGKRLNDSSKFKDELAQSGIASLESVEEKAKAVFTLLMSRLSWNGEYRLIPESASTVLKQGSGSNADLNMLYINMLHDVGVKAVPVVMRSRDRGQLPVTYPSLEKLNTFIVGIPDGLRMLYIDASATTGYFNVLPPKLYASQARVIEKGKCRWVNLWKVANGKENAMVTATLTSDGRLTGVYEGSYYGNEAANRRRAFIQAKDSAAYVAGLASKNGIEITDYVIEEARRFSPNVKERFSFVKQGDATADHIYVSPFVVAPLGESPFKQKERLLPVEFPYQIAQTITVSITIPDGYEVEELPKGASLSTSDKDISGRLSAVVNGNIVQVQYRFAVKNLHFLSENYPALKEMYDRFSDACQGMVVLKKK